MREKESFDSAQGLEPVGNGGRVSKRSGIFAKAPNARQWSPVSSIPITEKLLLNAGGWQAMKPARELLKSGRVSEVKYEPPLLSGYVREGRRIIAPACESKARSTLRISAAAGSLARPGKFVRTRSRWAWAI